jgi:hypothetical protein
MNKRATTMHKRITGLAGFSILEVMIGIFIFVVGLLALSALQGALTRSMADSKVRTTAANIAERTIEGHRGFTELISDTAVPPTFNAYNDIVDSTVTEVVNGITYTVTTDVTDHYYDISTDGFGLTAPTGALHSTYKQVEVAVSWNAAQNFRGDEGTEITAADIGSGEITLTATIPALVTSAAALVSDQDNTGDTKAPDITYTPGARPDIISLSLGDNKFKESLLPDPDVTVVDELVETTFDVITYSQSDAGAYFLRREEFASVSCECTLRAKSENNPGRRPVIWAGDEYARGQFAVKPYGESANNQQSWLCDTCCRDHHDGGTPVELADHADTAVNTYVPFKPSTEYNASGDHKHYYPDKKTGILTEVTSSGGTYIESCRLVRVDGFFRVAQDFRREDLHIFPADFLDDDNEVDLYSDFVTGAAGAYAALTSPDYETDPPCIGEAPCGVPPAPKQGPYDEAIVLDGEGNPTQFPSWTTIPYWDVLELVETQQLRSRGLYIDYLSYDLRTVLANCTTGMSADEADCKSGDVVLDRTGSVNALEMIPFFDVQMTKLNRWNEEPVPNIPVDTTNEPLANHNTHSRGIASYTQTGQSTVVASGHRGNIGFTDTFAIDPVYEETGASLTVHAGGDTGEPPVVDGTLISGNISETVPGDPTPIVTGVNGVLCGQTTPSYSCLVPVGAVNPRIEISGYGKKNINYWVCSVGDVLEKAVGEVTEGENAKAAFVLTGAPEGSNYNFVIQSDSCDTL